MEVSTHLGIDFGTCNSSAAVVRDGFPTPVKLRRGLTAIPSAVSVRDDGTLLVGAAAESAMWRWPDRFRRNFKTKLGENDPLYLGDRRLLPQELVAAVLARLKIEAEQRFHEAGPFNRAVLAVPAGYALHRKRLMEEAGVAAGFSEVELLAEPVAAATYVLWERREQPVWGEGDAVLVYDLGGGTFDAALLRRRGDGYDSLAAPISRTIGGDDFDQRIFAHLAGTVPAALRELLRERNDHGKLTRLVFQDACRKLKVALSDEPAAEELLPLEGQPLLALDRETFESLIADPVEETLQACRDLVAAAGLEPGGLRGGVLVGGSTLIPFVRRQVAAALQCEVFQPEDPALAVALGAALHGAASGARRDTPPPAPPPAPNRERYRLGGDAFGIFRAKAPE